MDTHMVSAAKWFNKSKYATGAIPLIFGIRFLVVTRTNRQWLPYIIQKLVWLFIHTDNRVHRVIWEFINIKDIFHAGYKISIFF